MLPAVGVAAWPGVEVGGFGPSFAHAVTATLAATRAAKRLPKVFKAGDLESIIRP